MHPLAPGLQRAGREAVLRLVDHADVLLEGYRPGVAERLGVGPDDCHDRNPRLVYGRMTGWGQEGPLAEVAGHDIGYIALAGPLWAIGRRDEVPTAPLNLVGDFGGGGGVGLGGRGGGSGGGRGGCPVPRSESRRTGTCRHPAERTRMPSGCGVPVP